MSQNDKQDIGDSFPVSVIMERRIVHHGQWQLPQWEVVGVVAGEHVGVAQRERSLIRSENGREQFLWTGFSVQLYRDSADSYWHNLVGKTPSLFVICQPQDDDGDLVPYIVSANYDEAGAHMEADGAVFSAPMPPEVYQWLERYVVANYAPREPQKRKRANWSKKQGTPHGNTPQTSRPPRSRFH